jgi:hypothetical protein
MEIFVLSLVTPHKNVILVKFHYCRLFHCYDSVRRHYSDNLVEIGSKFQIPEQVLHLKRKVVVPQHLSQLDCNRLHVTPIFSVIS